MSLIRAVKQGIRILGPGVCLATLAGSCRSEPESLMVAGTVEIREVAIAPLVAGRIDRLVHDEGDQVEAGDTVAVLVVPGLEERLAEARARRDAGVARVRDLEAGARSQEVEAARAVLDAALADSLRTWNELVRVNSLRAEDILTPSQLDNARSASESSNARVRQARELLELTAAGTRAYQVEAARAEAAALEASLSAMEAQQADLVLLAPSAGTVLMRLAEVGEVVAAGTPVAVMGITGEPWIRAFVDYERLPLLHLGAQVRVRHSAFPETIFRGEVVEIATEAEFVPRAALTERERADLVFAIRVALTDTTGGLRAGMPVDLEIEIVPLSTPPP